jgi:fumarylpyruvate hydrolase
MRMGYVIAPPKQPSMPVKGSSDLFPIRRIYCVGRNYEEHVREMGNRPGTDTPIFFQKPADAIVTDGVFPYPSATESVHHEIEFVVALKSGGRDIAKEKALDHVFGYAIGLDMTRRDLQQAAKKAGRPWSTGKGFDHSAPAGAIVPAAQCGHLAKGAMTLDVNGERRQTVDLSEMVWDVPTIIAELSRFFALAGGDIIFTGTPAGVAPVQRGDRLLGAVEGLGTLSVEVR